MFQFFGGRTWRSRGRGRGNKRGQSRGKMSEAKRIALKLIEADLKGVVDGKIYELIQIANKNMTNYLTSLPTQPIATTIQLVNK